jgi:hypothetical protein
MNDSLCCGSSISNVNLPITSLNLWLNSHTDLIYTCLISLSSVMYCNSEFDLLNYFKKACVISNNVFVWPSGVVFSSFMYHTSVRPLKFVSSCAIFTPSSWTFFVVHMVSHTNICCYGSSDPIPLKFGNISVLSTPSMLMGARPLLSDVGWVWLPVLLPLLWLLLIWLPLLIKSDLERSLNVVSDSGDVRDVGVLN